MPLKTDSFLDRFIHRFLGRPYQLHVIDHGGNGPVIIFLHGLASSSANWHYLIPLLQKSHRCLSIDLLGFGESPKPHWSEYTLEEHLYSIECTIKKLRLRQSFTLVGHSLGSLLATRYARLHVAQVGRLVLLSPPIYAPLYTITNRAARQRTSFYLKAYKFLRTYPRINPDNITKLTRLFPQLKFMTLNRQTWTPFIKSLEHCIENQTLIDDLRHTTMPVDIFYGSLDEVVVPYNVRQLASVRDVSLHPLNVQHAVTRRYAQAIARFLRDTPTNFIR